MLSRRFWLSLAFLMPFASKVYSSPSLSREEQTIVIGSKRFTENYILAEIFAQLLESHDLNVERRFGLGGTLVAFQALEQNEIDLYPDYTGTISEAVLKMDSPEFKVINQSLAGRGIEILPPLGFENAYCAVVRRELSEKLNLRSLSDLSRNPDLKGAFSFEFQQRRDGWPGLKKTYKLRNEIQGMDVPLTYEALKNAKVDFVEAYSTEPLIEKYDFVVLEDDKNYFPKYEAVAVVRKTLDPFVKSQIEKLSQQIPRERVIKMNLQAVQGVPMPQIANDFLVEKGFIDQKQKRTYTSGVNWLKMAERVLTHLHLTLLAVLLAILLAVPLGTLIVPYKKTSQVVLSVAGTLQTIPSIALLTFMIPFFGIGFKPAIVGLFIYSLLPILRNTHVAMSTIDPRLVMAARGIGLYPYEVLFSVKLPLAFPTILTGIRTATILSIGTATLAAFVGAGGLGEPIVTGLALNDTSQVLQGAIPAALLAIVVDIFFSFVSRKLTKEI